MLIDTHRGGWGRVKLWGKKSIIAAIRAVRSDELSQNAAARQYDVPVATLQRRLKTEQENALAEHVLNMEKILFGLSTNELRRLAFQYAEVNELKFWQRNKPNKILEIRDVGPIFGKAYAKAASASTAENGFRCTGIYPYNPNGFSDDLFAPSELTERENVINDENQVPKQNENILVARPKIPELRKTATNIA
ncbi:hypothetical protein NQ314_016699 [Rhamnusium bicolor]|uniref:HTH psq-type domain-containing protein n=1 Tax=Rhamnusium bicolor TaxID=1586634 RepID=A0AAV8WW48_9CUCU|nr:hypothetical protein NQ314_016699 [Rhamnusium bicolor]